MRLKLVSFSFTRYAFACLATLSISSSSVLFGQRLISGVINNVSAKVEDIFASESSDVDSIRVSSVSGFSAGDTVMIHMTVGVPFYTYGGNIGRIRSMNNVGKYAIFIIKEIDGPDRYIILNSTLPSFSKLTPGETGQVVKIPTYRRAKITGELTCNPYDPLTGTGGILVFFVKQGLIFDSDIDVSGKGFPGAQPDSDPYPGTCSFENAKYTKLYFTSSESNYGALKGYSISTITTDTIRGRGKIVIGGGGGNGRFSGGGGGANAGSGGNGGSECDSCGGADLGGFGGEDVADFFYKNDGSNRICLGGGGGTSSQILPDWKATAGGTGGGIVVIICDSLIGAPVQTYSIISRGTSVSDSATAGAGGGGAGGAVILHVNKYINNMTIEVPGGNGGNIDDNARQICGPGGGGGGGVIWYNGTVFDPGYNIDGGQKGTYKTDNYLAKDGDFGQLVDNLKIPIRGFLFNYIPDPDTICVGDAPKTINAAPPAGGTGVYTYNWLQSPNRISWTNADSVRNKFVYTPPVAIQDTMFYKRAVFDGFVYDTSNTVTLIVLPPLLNNSIKPDNDTTVCVNLNAGKLYTLKQMKGGNGHYRYNWESSSNDAFLQPDTVGNKALYTTPALTGDTWYRRKVVSGACRSTSNIIRIKTLPVIGNNTVESPQEICTTRTPAQLSGGDPSGGSGTYLYRWQRKNGGSWTDLVTTPAYQPPALTSTQGYRRIVISGPVNTCRDTSPELMITVMPVITNNTVDAITQNILCSGLQGEILKGSTRPLLSGGNGEFRYYWQIDGKNSGNFSDSTGFNPGILTSTSVFRRIVTSGINSDSLQRCWSISNTRTISILENITNNDISTPKAVWCQGKTPFGISGTVPEKGDGTYSYSWLSRRNGNGWSIEDASTKDLDPPVITSGIDYRRIVKSGLNLTCIDTSSVLSYIMQDSIKNNTINLGIPVYICNGSDSLIRATVPPALTGGDESNYAFLWKEGPGTDTSAYTPASEPSRTNALYKTEALSSERYYTRRVISGDCENTSRPVKVSPLPLPVLTGLSTVPSEVCYSALDSVIRLTITNGTPPYRLSLNNGHGFNEPATIVTQAGRIMPQVSDPDVNPGYNDYNYSIASLRDFKGCRAENSNLGSFIVPLRIYTTPVPSRLGDATLQSCSPDLKIPVSPSFGIGTWHLKDAVRLSQANNSGDTLRLFADFSKGDYASAGVDYVEDIANCASDTVRYDVILYYTPDSIKNIYRMVEDETLAVGDTVVIFISDNQGFSADPIFSGKPQWMKVSGAGELSDTFSLKTKISGLEQDNPAVLEYSISNGVCPVNTRTIKIERKELLIYDGFSPNDDHINDELYSVGLADPDVEFKLQIFSSSGAYIREITRKDITRTDLLNNEVVLWDGTTNMGGTGNFVPDGTYYYVLTLTYHGESFNKRGFVIVKR
jgi:hypothetical protein